MLITLNEKGNLEIGNLVIKDKQSLLSYRNSLLEKNSINFKIENSQEIKELCYYHRYDEKFYPQGDKLVHEEFIKPINNTIPFTAYNYLYNKSTIECKNLITIQILTKLLLDWYTLEDDEIIKHFIDNNIIKLLHPLFLSSQIPDPTKCHIGMHKLIEPGHEQDLRSFQNSLDLIEFYVSEELAFDELTKLPYEKMKSLSLDTPLDEIIANSKILYGKKKINKRITKKMH